jgi:hypothetical protein
MHAGQESRWTVSMSRHSLVRDAASSSVRGVAGPGARRREAGADAHRIVMATDAIEHVGENLVAGVQPTDVDLRRRADQVFVEGDGFGRGGSSGIELHTRAVHLCELAQRPGLGRDRNPGTPAGSTLVAKARHGW